MKPVLLIALSMLLLFGSGARAAQPNRVTLLPSDRDRMYVPMADDVTLQPPFAVRDLDSGKDLPCQWTPGVRAGAFRVHWLVPHVARGQARHFAVARARAPQRAAMAIVQNNGYLTITGGGREITRYYFGPMALRHKKPYMYPLMVGRVNLCRGFPMDPHPGETTDHPHHTGVWFAHGEVNKKDFWATDTIRHDKFILQDAGPVMAHIVALNDWGRLVNETQDIRVYNIGEDVLMDWSITLEANGRPVLLGKTKEGGFSIRVNTGLTSPDPGKTAKQQPERGHGRIVDADGHTGEHEVRQHAAPWADDTGEIGGKVYGVAIMNHPTSFRYPTNWHVRNYGLFAANAFFMQGEYTLQPGSPITLRYRLYGHAGNAKEADVEAVYAGYTQTRTGN